MFGGSSVLWLAPIAPFLIQTNCGGQSLAFLSSCVTQCGIRDLARFGKRKPALGLQHHKHVIKLVMQRNSHK